MIENDYLGLFIFFIICGILATLLVLITYIVSPKEEDNEKLSSYECGFEPFHDARIKFNVHFYLVAILFIIFDLEVAFLFPFCSCSKFIGDFGFWSVLVFLIILTIGFLYEWTKGALKWK